MLENLGGGAFLRVVLRGDRGVVAKRCFLLVGSGYNKRLPPVIKVVFFSYVRTVMSTVS